MYRYISCESVSPFDLLPCYLHVFRELFSNAISGTLPDAIGLLTGLWTLCVAARRHCFFDAPPRLTFWHTHTRVCMTRRRGCLLISTACLPVRSIDVCDACPQVLAVQSDHRDDP